jgi:hypothetical protein
MAFRHYGWQLHPRGQRLELPYPLPEHEGRQGTALNWVFEDIDLVDSTTDELNSYGFINFRIAPYPKAPKRTVIKNKAAIYFDFDSAIITNEPFVTLLDKTIQSPDQIQVDVIASYEETPAFREIVVYPNPTSSKLNIQFESAYLGQVGISVWDVTGKQVMETSAVKDAGRFSNTIEMGGLGKGLYLIKLVINDNTVQGKVVVE